MEDNPNAEDFPSGDVQPETTTTEVVFEELPLISKDETIRLECLALAVHSAIRGSAGAELMIARAELFVDYVKNGETNAEDK